jgi:hypothetical protein
MSTAVDGVTTLTAPSIAGAAAWTYRTGVSLVAPLVVTRDVRFFLGGLVALALVAAPRGVATDFRFRFDCIRPIVSNYSRRFSNDNGAMKQRWISLRSDEQRLYCHYLAMSTAIMAHGDFRFWREIAVRKI